MLEVKAKPKEERKQIREIGQDIALFLVEDETKLEPEGLYMFSSYRTNTE